MDNINLKELRKKSGLTAQQCADKLGVTRSYLYKVEKRGIPEHVLNYIQYMKWISDKNNWRKY